jgi:hypothetical protein
MFQYIKLWNDVRERVLIRELACVNDMLALSDDKDYAMLTESEKLRMSVSMLEHQLRRGNEDDTATAYATLKANARDYLKGFTSSQLPDAEAYAIALAMLIMLQDYIAD